MVPSISQGLDGWKAGFHTEHGEPFSQSTSCRDSATCPLDLVDETAVQEFVADLKRTTFEMRKPNGDLIKTYKLSRKTILNIVGVVKLVLGEKGVDDLGKLDLGQESQSEAAVFQEEAAAAEIIEPPKGSIAVLFALLAGTGMRIGEAAGLQVEDLDLDNLVIHVRRSFCETANCYVDPKSDAGFREVDIDYDLAQVLRGHLGERRTGLVFQSEKGTSLRGGNIIKRVLNPIQSLGIPRGGKVLHAFRRGRVTVLRVKQTPGDLSKQWIGHSSLRTTDGYSHTNQELEYRRLAASKAGLSVTVGPNGPNLGVGISRGSV